MDLVLLLGRERAIASVTENGWKVNCMSPQVVYTRTASQSPAMKSGTPLVFESDNGGPVSKSHFCWHSSRQIYQIQSMTSANADSTLLRNKNKYHVKLYSMFPYLFICFSLESCVQPFLLKAENVSRESTAGSPPLTNNPTLSG